MITANELRIGNWVSHLGTPTKLFTGAQIDANHKNISGLAVTSTILEKARFEKIDEVKFILGNGYFYDCANHWVRMAGEGVWPIIATNVILVHRLQNLYFALTEEELEINL